MIVVNIMMTSVNGIVIGGITYAERVAIHQFYIRYKN